MNRLTAVGLLLLACLAPLGGRGAVVDAATSNRLNLIRLQMINDMMFAADDFFGDMRHLIYADQAKSAAAVVAPVVASVAPKQASSRSSSRSSSSERTVARDNGGSGRTGGGRTDPGGGGDPGGGDPGGGGCPT